MAIDSLPNTEPSLKYTLPHTTKCVICNRPFYGSPGHLANGWAKYCSRACRGVDQRQMVKPTEGWSDCRGCGTPFRQKPSAMINGKAKTYCSAECRGQKRVLTCDGCGKQVSVFRSYRQRESFHCSRECKAKSDSQKIDRVCVYCTQTFQVKPSALTHKKGSGSFCSIHCKAGYMSGTQLTIGGVNRNTRKGGGKREDLDGRYFRSGWEANYARYLNWLIEKKQIARWEFEPDTFEFDKIKRGTRHYTPDFKVFELDGTYAYHEVKGYMDAKSQTKLKRFAKYFPKEKLVLIDSPVYKSIAKTMRGLIANWE